jgi:hypothetical protein
MKACIALVVAIAAAAAAPSAMAASASANTTAQANIVAPGQISATRTLEFGTIAKPSTGTTTVTVASASSDTATPGVSGGNGFVPTAGQAHAATFHLIGANAQTYSVTANTLTFTNATGNLTNVGPETPVSAASTLNTLPASGTDDLYVGGHFDISTTTTVQAYSGTISLTVNFN